MSDPRVLLEKDHRTHIARLTLNQPERKNCYDPEMRRAMHAAMDDVAADDMFKVSGATVYPSEVEAALLAIPAVARAYVTNLSEPAIEHSKLTARGISAMQAGRARRRYCLPISPFISLSCIRIGRPDSLSAWPCPFWWISNTDWIAA